MVDSQITLTISLGMIVLFVLAVVGFSIGFANDNDATMSVADDTELSDIYSKSSGNISLLKNQSEDTYQSILSSTIEPGSDVVQSAGPFAITPTNVVGTTSNIITLPYKKIFGSGSEFGVFFTAFISFLLFVIGLLIYKTLRGSP